MADFNKRAILGYTDEMNHSLRNIALASLAIGAGTPLIQDILRAEHPLMLPTSGGVYASIPVPESSMSEALPYYESPPKKRRSKSVKELKNFDIAKVVKSGALSVRPHSLLSERSFTTEVVEKRSSDVTKLLSYLWNNDLVSGIRGAVNSFGVKDVGANALTYQNLTSNPYFLPGVTAAVAAPLATGYMLSKKLIRDRDFADKRDDTSDAKEEFSKALLLAQENSPVRQVIKAGSGNRDIDELYAILEKLASAALDGQEKDAGVFGDIGSSIARGYNYANDVTKEMVKSVYNNPLGSIPRAFGTGGVFLGENAAKGVAYGLGYDPETIGADISEGIKGIGTDTAAFTDKMWNGFKHHGGKLLTGIGGLGMATALLSGGAGTYYGHRAAKNEDTDTEESYKYLSEFLRRQQEEGTPINVMPVPVAPKVKKPWYSMG